MIIRDSYHLPTEQRELLRRAVRLEWWSIGFLVTIILLMYVTMGSSQAMKTAWLEDLLSLIPPIVFLISARNLERPPNRRYPYGYHRISSIAFLAASVTLTILGLYMVYDAASSLLSGEHPGLGGLHLFGYDVWSGWVMIAALIYSMIPPVILGNLKKPLAEKLHQKTLNTDADMNRADWMTAAAGVVGIIGIGLGFPWADAVAAGVIALDVSKDGLTNLKQSISDLMDAYPEKVSKKEIDELPSQVRARIESIDWVERAAVRMREEGDLLAGEVFVHPVERQIEDPAARLEEIRNAALETSWRIGDVVATFYHLPSDLERELEKNENRNREGNEENE